MPIWPGWRGPAGRPVEGFRSMLLIIRIIIVIILVIVVIIVVTIMIIIIVVIVMYLMIVVLEGGVPAGQGSPLKGLAGAEEAQPR